MTDSRDGQKYKTVTIGNQIWMAQNLNYETPNSWCAVGKGKKDDCSKYGRLYTWAAAVGETEEACGYGRSTCTVSSNVQGACPIGWHVPSQTEWTTLFTAVGGDSIAHTALKATSDWSCKINGNGTDDFLFSALPANGSDGAYFWSSTQSGSGSAEYAHLFCGYGYSPFDSFHGRKEKNFRFSVRCLKDEAPGQTVEISSIVDSMIDSRDGQTYKTVTIGEQTWMAQNLNYQTANSYCYNDKADNCTKYGRLYKWSVAMDSAGTWSNNGNGCGSYKQCSPIFPVRGVCPEGWHVPSQTEWNTLFTTVGGENAAGSKLKSSNGWFNRSNGTDDFSFSVLPAGYGRLGPIFKKDENHPFISLFLEMGRRWATRRLGSARRSV